MPKLSNGQVVGISSERARYHATRRKLRLHPDSPHHQLYELIDVIFADPADSPDQWLRRYRFSGYTLADLPRLGQWHEGDRRLFFDWLQQDLQVSEVEAARKWLACDAGPVKVHSHDYPQRLYSRLRQRLEALPQPRADIRQWHRTLQNKQAAGIRNEEIIWSGLPEYLDQARRNGQQVIEKSQLLAAIDFSPIRLELTNELMVTREPALPFDEVAQRLPLYRLALAGAPVNEDDVAVIRAYHPTHNYRIGELRRGGRALSAQSTPRWFALGPYNELLGEAPDGLLTDRQAAIETVRRHAQRTSRLGSRPSLHSRYGYITLHGGEEYREWLLTLPDYQRSWFNGHFYERNVLAHIRTTERHDTQGRRLLFIEEIQSDWHQSGARHGYDNQWNGKIPVAPFRKEWLGLALKLMLIHAVESGLEGIGWADGAIQALRFGDHLPALRRRYDHEIPRLLERLGRPFGQSISHTMTRTRRPWLGMRRMKGKWQVSDWHGRFTTRPRYTQEEAQQLMERHSRRVELSIPVFWLPPAMRRRIREQGLPLFGEQLFEPD